MTRKILAPLALTALIAFPGLAAARERAASLDLSLPLQLLANLGGSATLDCDTNVDREDREMMNILRRSGRYESRNEDGRLAAWKLGDRFRMKATDEDGEGKFTLEMPWAAAECLFGGTGPRRIKLESLERQGGFQLRISDGDGDIKLAVD